jgi:tetratricopeptide (TPR) repeat protein
LKFDGYNEPMLPRFNLIAFLVPVLLLAQQDRPQEPTLQIQVDVVGRVVRSKGTWAEIQTRNFLVTGDAAESDLRLAASELELFRSQFAELIPRAKDVSSVPTRVLVMRDAGVGELLQPGPDVNYVVLSAGQKLPRDVIRAYVPLLMRDGLSPIALWFQEGLAEYFSTYKLDRLGDSRIVKLGLDDYKGNVSGKKLMPLSTLFSVNSDSLEFTDKEAGKLFSAQSCALVTYLIQTRRLGAAVRFLNSEAEGHPMSESFRNEFKLSLPTFEGNFKYHVNYSRSHGWSVDFSGFSLDANKRSISVFYANEPRPLSIPANFDTVRDEAGKAPLRTLTDARAEYYRGDFLLHADRLEEAEAYLKNAILLDASYSPAHASLGRLQTLGNRYAEARSSLQRAAELDPRNYMAHYYTALLLRKESAAGAGTLSHRDVERAIKGALKKTVDLAPEFVEATELLAQTNLTLHEELGPSAQLLMNGLRRSPGRQSLMMTFAQVVAEGGQKPVAGWMLQRVIASGAGNTQLRQDARDLLYALDLTETQRTAFGDFGILDSTEGEKGVSVRLSSTQIKAARKQARRDEKEEKVVRGFLTRVDCSKGLTLYIRIGTRDIDERIENVHTDNPEDIDWVTDSDREPGPIECGPAARPVSITYRPQRKGLMMGVPLVVEYVSGPD